jgi:hypothetical protein
MSPEAATPVTRRLAGTTTLVLEGSTVCGWGSEHDAASLAALDVVQVVDGFALRLRYALAGPAGGQFAALTHETPGGLAQSDRLIFTARAERPMRITVQLRTTGGEEDRWEQSAYVDTFDQERTIMFDDMRPLSPGAAPHPDLAKVRSLMFVVDTVNTKPGSSGLLWIKSAALGRRARSAPTPAGPHGAD